MGVPAADSSAAGQFSVCVHGKEVVEVSIDILGNIDPRKINLAAPGLSARNVSGGPKGTGEEQAHLVKDALPGKREVIDQAIAKLKGLGDLFNRRLDFRVDQETHRVVVKVIDTETDTVIKEIPPEQVLRLAAKIQEMIGLMVDEER
jgi:flagellar protein FlaG